MPESPWQAKKVEAQARAQAPPAQAAAAAPLHRNSPDDDTNGITPENYLSAIGALMYVSNNTRPDLAHAANTLAGDCAKITSESVVRLSRVFKYWRSTAHLGLTFTRQDKKHRADDARLVVYSDADWAGDVETRRSTSGILAMFAGAAIHWKSVRQSCVAMSSTEAEYMAAAEAALTIQWLRPLLSQIGRPQTEPTPLLIDNSTTLRMAMEEKQCGRRKHIDVKHHKLRELNGIELQTSWVSTDAQLADLLTKALGQSTFERLRDAVLGRVHLTRGNG